MKDLPFIRFYPSKFVGGCRGLNATEVGIYILLLCKIYEEDGPIEADPVKLSAHCGVREKVLASAVGKMLRLGKLTEENGFLSNGRAVEEMRDRAKRIENSSAGGKAKAKKDKQNQGASSSEALVQQCHKDKDKEEERKDIGKPISQRKGTRLPVDWVIPPEWGSWAVDQGMSREEAWQASHMFKDYWIAQTGARSTKLDWFATWRNWVRNNLKSASAKGAKPNAKHEFDRTVQQIAAGLSAGEIHLGSDGSDPFAK